VLATKTKPQAQEKMRDIRLKFFYHAKSLKGVAPPVNKEVKLSNCSSEDPKELCLLCTVLGRKYQ
jgi:hypothetical protein